MLRKVLCGVLLTVLVPGLCLADPIINSFTDITSNVPGTVYTLTIDPLGGLLFSVTLTAQTVDLTASADWYINWIRLQFDGGSQPTVSGFSGPSADWNILGDGDGQVDLLKADNFPQGGRIGIFADGVVDDGSIDITQGALLNGGSYLWSWDITLAGGTSLNLATPLQVGYFDGFAGGSQNILFTQLSQEFPAPATLFLLGAGLLAWGMVRRARLGAKREEES